MIQTRRRSRAVRSEDPADVSSVRVPNGTVLDNPTEVELARCLGNPAASIICSNPTRRQSSAPDPPVWRPRVMAASEGLSVTSSTSRQSADGGGERPHREPVRISKASLSSADQPRLRCRRRSSGALVIPTESAVDCTAAPLASSSWADCRRATKGPGRPLLPASLSLIPEPPSPRPREFEGRCVW